MDDRYNAYIAKDLIVEPYSKGELNNKTFSVKDVFSIKGYLNAAGNPDWFKSHQASEQTADAIVKLLNQGAKLQGTTHTDELMYSINGENHHYGTPDNPKAPGHIPGGSSSGSAVAVAGEIVDFALGTDTGGSVRIPSSYCGIYGIRPTHGAVSLDGVIPLAKSFDTVGWMARDPETLLKVGRILIEGQNLDQTSFTTMIIAEDAWDLVEEQTKLELMNRFKLFNQMGINVKTAKIAKEGLSTWADVFRSLQGLEIWEEHGEWIDSIKPTFGPGIAERFRWASTLKKYDHSYQLSLKEEIKNRLSLLLGKEGVLLIPTAPAPAPLKGLTNKELEDRRTKTMQLSCIAGIAGLPQITLPLAEVDGKPVGLSLIANRNQDLRLLNMVASFELGEVQKN